jgi:hypothetical protein
LEGDASGGVGPGNTKQAHLSLREAIEAAAAKLGQVPIDWQNGSRMDPAKRILAQRFIPVVADASCGARS